MMKKNRLLIGTGLLLLAAALFLSVYNVREDKKAGASARTVFEILENDRMGAEDKETAPLYERYPQMEMPTVEVEGKRYIGTLELPSLELTLPVMEELSREALKIAPCRYKGSAYSGDLILAAHNYRSHFGRLSDLGIGDEVAFTDADGNRFTYRVEEILQLAGTDVEAMEEGEWDLTLFTCTYGGKNRVTVRCTRWEESPETTGISP